MNTEEFTRTLPGAHLTYGYKLRDYRKSTGKKLRWSWAIEYKRETENESETETDYGYSHTRLGAIFAARIALLKAAWKSGING